MPKTLTPEIVLAAIAGFELQKAKLDSQIAELTSMLDGSGRSESANSTPTGRPRKKFSAATRRKMAAAQRARYSELRQGSEPTQPVITKPKRELSTKGRRAISIAAKKRWRAIKAAKKVA
jgi:hypothetical protein